MMIFCASFVSSWKMNLPIFAKTYHVISIHPSFVLWSSFFQKRAKNNLLYPWSFAVSLIHLYKHYIVLPCMLIFALTSQALLLDLVWCNGWFRNLLACAFRMMLSKNSCLWCLTILRKEDNSIVQFIALFVAACRWQQS